jgi:hypothetical protein
MIDNSPDLASVLMSFVTCAATDPRGKVWALLRHTRAVTDGPEAISLDRADPPLKLVGKVAGYLVDQDDYLRTKSKAYRTKRDGLPLLLSVTMISNLLPSSTSPQSQSGKP